MQQKLKYSTTKLKISQQKIDMILQKKKQKYIWKGRIKMYINDIHIAYYAIAIIASIFIGQLVDWANKRIPEYKTVISKDIITEMQNGISNQIIY